MLFFQLHFTHLAVRYKQSLDFIPYLVDLLHLQVVVLLHLSALQFVHFIDMFVLKVVCFLDMFVLYNVSFLQ